MHEKLMIKLSVLHFGKCRLVGSSMHLIQKI